MVAEPGDGLPASVRVVIEVPRGGFVKRAANGAVDFVSPCPSPFNYGSAPDLPGQDGEPADALVLGPRLPRGDVGRWPVYGRVRFDDEGVVDDKLICARAAPGRAEIVQMERFFQLYARVKSAWARMRGQGAVTFHGLELRA